MHRTASCCLLLLLAVACGGGGGKRIQSCDDDGTCVGGICFEQACYKACAQPSECIADDVCVHRVGDGRQVDVCVAASEFEGCTLDADCAALVSGPCGLAPICGTDTGLCVVPPADESVACESSGQGGRCASGTCTATTGPNDVEGPDSRDVSEPPDIPASDDAAADPGAPELPAAEASDVAADEALTSPDACTPDCQGRTCDDDGCGGSCGTCQAPAACFDSLCQADPMVSPHFVGTYRVQTDLDIAGGAPAAFAAVLQRMIATLVDPSTALLLRSCDLTGTAAADLCQLAFIDPSTPDAAALSPLGQAIQAHVQAWMSVQVPEWQPGGIPGLRASLDEAFGAVRLGATFGMGSDPGADGTISTSGASWDKASLRWPFRLDCDPTDDACGRLEVDLANLGTGKLGQPVGSKAVLEAAGWTLDVQAHTFTLHLGKVVAWLFWGNALPELYGDGADGQPYIDSWQKLVRASLAGQRACVDVGNCCELFANAIAAIDETASVSLLLDACEVLAAEEPQNDLVNADLTQNNLTLTTDPAVPCRLYDLDADGVTDAWGLAAPLAKRCAWWFFWSAGTAVSLPNTFWATSDVATP